MFGVLIILLWPIKIKNIVRRNVTHRTSTFHLSMCCPAVLPCVPAHVWPWKGLVVPQQCLSLARDVCTLKSTSRKACTGIRLCKAGRNVCEKSEKFLDTYPSENASTVLPNQEGSEGHPLDHMCQERHDILTRIQQFAKTTCFSTTKR
jgi:hypothetical protein